MMRRGEIFEPLAGKGLNSSKSLVESFTSMIERGDLVPGTRLPTVRALAAKLNISPSTVASCWTQLRSIGLIETRRRGGTVITNAAQLVRFEKGAWSSLNLATNAPDPNLLPSLEKAFLKGLRAKSLHHPSREHLTDQLRAAVERDWPFQPQAWSTGAGGAEAAYLAFEAAVEPGGVVAVEQPTSPRILEALTDLDFRLIGVSCDEEGPRADELARAIELGARTFIFQPRAQIPLGHDVTNRRIHILAEVISNCGFRVHVVEDDNVGPLSASAVPSLGSVFPDSILHVRAYCRAYGSDLKAAVIGGGADLVQRMNRLRSGGRAVSSRIVQDALAFLIEDGETKRKLIKARDRYARRHSIMASALKERGVSISNSGGSVLWLPTENEGTAMVRLAMNGIAVGAGSLCYITPPAGDGHIRLSTYALTDNFAQNSRIADLIASVLTDRSSREYE